MSVRSKIAGIAPAPLARVYRRVLVGYEFLVDCRQYMAATRGVGRERRASSKYCDMVEYYSSRLTVLTHGLEKGASYPAPYRPYGRGRIDAIRSLLAQKEVVELGISTEYAELVVRAVETYNLTGAISEEVTPTSVWEGQAVEFEQVEKFLRSRHSVRNFDKERDVPDDVVREAVRLAGLTPSVCNRRAYRVHYYSDLGQIQRMLALQNGNRGFGSTIPRLAVVTVRRSSFSGAGERNQRWIDGGLFAMNVMWALHSQGIGTCFLNWSEVSRNTQALRTVGEISAAEDIVVLIAVGYPAVGHRVARSPERPIGDLLVEHL